ncbi:proton-coupled folate transporter [Procambarus clarkii]|uniref:proton-coupled folate transporter n=1 Tax=Procambarus clarkii TaxID=6728 RepID=UPI00374491F9
MHEINENTPLVKGTHAGAPKTHRSRIVQTLADVTVEPALMLHSIAFTIDQVYLTNLRIDKICLISFKYSAEICRNLDAGNHTVEQDEVQRLASDYNVYYHWAEYLPALISLAILGAWGDTRGRRLPLILPFIGGLLTSLAFLANVYWWTLPAPFLILSKVPLGITGGMLGLDMNVCAYMSAISRNRSRTFRLSSTEWLKYGCYPLGTYLALLLYGYGGYLAVFLFQVLLYAAALVYLVVRLKEPSSKREENGQATTRSVCEVFSPSALKRTFTLIWKPRGSGGRTSLILHTVILLLAIFMLGVKNYYFLYTRKQFDWDYEQYADWTLLDYPVKAIGTLIVVPLLSYYCRAEDSMLIFIGSVSAMFFYVLFGTAPVPWVLYFASAVSFCSLIPAVAARSTISKGVLNNELGSIFAMLGVTQCVLLLVAPSLYTLTYNFTLDFFPGTLFLVMAGVAAVVGCISVWILTHHQPRQQ